MTLFAKVSCLSQSAYGTLQKIVPAAKKLYFLPSLTFAALAQKKLVSKRNVSESEEKK